MAKSIKKYKFSAAIIEPNWCHTSDFPSPSSALRVSYTFLWSLKLQRCSIEPSCIFKVCKWGTTASLAWLKMTTRQSSRSSAQKKSKNAVKLNLATDRNFRRRQSQPASKSLFAPCVFPFFSRCTMPVISVSINAKLKSMTTSTTWYHSWMPAS